MNKKQTIKLFLIVGSLILVLISLNSKVIILGKDSASLSYFKGLYVYYITILVALYQQIKNRNSNLFISLSLLTYIWTLFDIFQMRQVSSIANATYGNAFFIYLISACLLLISLFVREETPKAILNKVSKKYPI